MKKIVGIAFLILIIGLMSACSKDEPTNANAGKKESTNAIAGNDVFQKSCITCHSSGDITGGQIKLDSTKIHNDFKSKDDLLSFVQANMPKSEPGSLSKEQYDAVVKYLWDQK